jgi:CRP-like cAMP-binding protein
MMKLLALLVAAAATIDNKVSSLVLPRPAVNSFSQTRLLSFRSRDGGAVLSENDGEPNFEEYEELKELREYIRDASIFQDASKIELEVMIQLMKKTPVSEGEMILAQGETDKDIYIVASGSFAALDKITGERRKMFEVGEVFGELSYAFDKARSLSIQALEDSVVWVMGAADLDDVLAIRKDTFTKAFLKSTLAKTSGYNDFLDRQEREQIMRGFPLFKKLDAAAIEHIIDSIEDQVVMSGDQVVTQGEEGDRMYFIKSGTFECYEEQSGKVLKVLEAGDYFGELSLFLQSQRSRRLSVRCVSDDGVLWQLCEQAVSDLPIGDDLIKLLINKYKVESVFGLIGILTFAQVYELAVIKSRPKKASVSWHSTLSSATALAAMLVLLPTFAPGFDEFGYPQIFDYNRGASDDLICMAEWVVVLQVLGAVMGIFRLPPASPLIRRVGMTAAAAATVRCHIPQSPV